MMFRFGKIIESNNKTSRSDRFAEMSKQQQLIESKKQEIKAKFEERKRQEAVESTSKTGHRSGSDHKNRDHKSLTNSRMQSWKKDDRWRKKSSHTETSESSTNNYFSNDGSFLEKYQRMAQMKPPESTDTSEATHSNSDFDSQTAEQITRNENQHFGHTPNIDKNVMPHTKFGDCSEGIPYPPPNMNMLPVSSSLVVTSQQQSLYSLTSRPPPSAPPPTIHTSLAAVSASVPLLSAVASSGTSLQTVSLIQVPVSVPASSVILSCPIETALVSSEPVVHLPVVHSTLSHGSISVPLQTTVIPAQIQITSQAAMPQSVQISQSSTNVILSQTLQPQSILVSECMRQPTTSTTLPNTNVPPPMLPAPPPQPPAPVFASVPPYRMSQPATPDTTTLPPVHLPPPNYNPMAAHCTEPSMRGLPSAATNCKTHLCSKESDGFERSLFTSESDERQRTYKSRDDSRDNRDNGSNNLEDMEAVARVVADCGDDMENVLLLKCSSDDKLSFLRDKQSPPYIAFRSMVEKLRRERKIEGSRETSQSESRNDSKRFSRVPADDGDSDSEETEERRRRKRKRRSRWAPEDSKVELPATTSVDSSAGIAVPTALGTIVPVKPPTQTPKLSVGIGGPMISQVTRTDPALLQYTMKAFGTINLSEEDWKKAEDHYKINLLYQDMLKKKQELERLQAAGKHKYAYDSDEDTEGGTWEHKLRTMEMTATQLWADELTEKAKGKHHIGDFLPPDELERFMEKYNALKQGREPDLSDYKEFKLREDNIGFQMLQKLGWSEGQGLGSDGSGIVNPVNKAPSYNTSHGLGVEKPDDVTGHDDEYDAYRKRMMLAYRFRPNPLNNPRRPYY